MEEKQSAALECLAHIAYETRPDAVFEHVAKAMKEVLEAQEIFFYVRHDGRWLSLWPQEGARPRLCRVLCTCNGAWRGIFSRRTVGGVLALHGVQQAEGAVWAVHMPACPCARAKALARTLCTAAAPKLAALFRHSQSGAPLDTDRLAAVSHEVRTPLAVAMSAVELLRAKLKKENEEVFHAEYEPYFFHLEHNLNRTLHLAQNMMEIAGLKPGRTNILRRTAASGRHWKRCWPRPG